MIASTLHVTCSCEAAVVNVHSSFILNGEPRSCGRRRCPGTPAYVVGWLDGTHPEYQSTDPTTTNPKETP